MTERKTCPTKIRNSIFKNLEKIIEDDIKNKKSPYSKATMADLAINDGIEKYCKDNDLSIKKLYNIKKAQNKKDIILKKKPVAIKKNNPSIPKKTYSVNKETGNKIEDVFISGN